MAIELYTQRGALCGTFLAGEFVAGAEGDQFILPASLTLEGDDFDLRVDSDERALADGSAAWGGQVRARKAVVSGLVGDGTSTPEATRALLRQLRAAAARQDQYLATDQGADHFLRLRLLESCDVRWQALWGRSLAQVRLSWLLADPFWYSDAVGQVHEDLAGSGSISVDTGDLATWWMPPIITLTAPAGESVPSVTLVNQTDGGVGLTYSDPAFADGATVVIDCERGTVRRDGVDSIRYLGGRPLRLLPGLNTLSYTGAACAVSIQWRERWI
jgi:hypothetical protein